MNKITSLVDICICCIVDWLIMYLHEPKQNTTWLYEKICLFPEEIILQMIYVKYLNIYLFIFV